MSAPVTVAIDADGTCHDYFFVIVAAKTGVAYTHQCGGFACMQNSLEGFLVQIGTPADERKIYDWFQLQFRGCCENSSVWTPENTEALEQLVSSVACWHMDPGGLESRHFLGLDRSRMQECVEAWIPVISPYGPGIMVLNNSD